MHALTQDIWTVEAETWMSSGVCFSNRMSVIKRADGGLVLHAPVELDASTLEQLAALGPVTDIIAPNLMHHLHAGAAKAHFPTATLWGPPGLQDKEGLAIDRLLAAGEEIPGLLCIPLPSGPKLGEHVFLHPASGTLVLCDLIFNMQNPSGWAMPMLMRVVGCHKCASSSKSLKWVFVKEDFPSFAKSVKALEKLEFSRIIVNHGDVIEDQAKTTFKQATAWMHA
jgi:hypothetical protein